MDDKLELAILYMVLAVITLGQAYRAYVAYKKSKDHTHRKKDIEIANTPSAEAVLEVVAVLRKYKAFAGIYDGKKSGTAVSICNAATEIIVLERSPSLRIEEHPSCA